MKVEPFSQFVETAAARLLAWSRPGEAAESVDQRTIEFVYQVIVICEWHGGSRGWVWNDGRSCLYL